MNEGYTLVRGGKGTHIKYKKPGAPTIIIPENRNNLSPGVARNILDALGYNGINDIPKLTQ